MTRINQLLQVWPHGAVLTARRLGELGCSPDLLRKYVRSRWIEPIGRGAYRLPQAPLDWLGGVYALQSQLGLSIHPGGKTALAYKGSSHYIPQGSTPVFLYGRRSERLPKWFAGYPWPERINYQATMLVSTADPAYLSQYEHRQFTVRISSRELAILEVLYHVPHSQGFDEALRLMENLPTLRPQVVQSLLRECRSIKVKRLFLYMGERAGHAWFSKLDTSSINLGTGKRMIVKGGTLDRKYGITVPKGQAL